MIGSTLPDLREHLAAERTFLAYVRTSLAMMGLGLLIARLGTTEVQPLAIGAALVFLGVALMIASLLTYRSLIRRLNASRAAQWPPSPLPEVTAVTSAACGTALGIWVITLL